FSTFAVSRGRSRRPTRDDPMGSCRAGPGAGRAAGPGRAPRRRWVKPEGRGNLRGLAPNKGEWSPRYEKGVYNRSGREDLQGRAPDREQVVRLGPLAWISDP